MVEFIVKRAQRLVTVLGVLSLLLVVMGCSTESPITVVTPFAMESAEINSSQTVSLPTSEPGVAGQTAAADLPGDNSSVSALPPPIPTPTLDPLPPVPIMEQIPRGQALQQAKADDIAREITAPNPIQFDTEPVTLRFDEFFVDFDPFSEEPPVLSDKLLSLDGKRVIIEGYMAPPLKLGLDWFMLTGFPMGFCPFHSSSATITPDIALIYVEGPELQYFYEPLRIEGELHVGESVDWQTGMVSLVRIYTSEDTVESIQFGGQ